jgi:hypothetical protein
MAQEQIHIRLDSRQTEQLRALAHEKGTTVTELMRQAVADMLTQQEEEAAGVNLRDQFRAQSKALHDIRQILDALPAAAPLPDEVEDGTGDDITAALTGGAEEFL